MPKSILGSGIKFPISLGEDDTVALSQHEQKIKESIWIILETAKGERVMRPDFGCDIHNFVFSVMNTTVLTQMENAVQEALILWEPRIEVLAVNASAKNLSQGKVDINIDYKIRYTNTAYNLVYPFYLESEGRLS
jgi:uncharacterized protein